MKKQLIILSIALSILLIKEMEIPVLASNTISFISEGVFNCDNLTTDPSDDVIFDVDDLNALADYVYELKDSRDSLSLKVTTLQGKLETLKEVCK